MTIKAYGGIDTLDEAILEFNTDYDSDVAVTTTYSEDFQLSFLTTEEVVNLIEQLQTWVDKNTKGDSK